ncbi:MAG: hypothetical protein ABIW76_18130 [Fibrobacteria bacterium]
MKSRLFHFTTLLLAFCLASCWESEGGKDPDGTDPQSTDGAVSHDYSYATKENTLYLTRDQIWRRCLGDSLAADTVRARTDTIEFEIEGNTWRHLKPPETSGSAVIRWVRTYKRVGAGTGLEGVWSRSGDSYRLVSGVLNLSEQALQDAVMKNLNLSLKYSDDRITVTGSSYTEHSDIRLADQFVDFWNGTIFPGLTPDSAIFDIGLRVVDKYTVELKGFKNKETVRLARYPNGDMSITSSNPGHASLHYYGEPESCPNTQEPPWYKAFLDANRKGL